MAPRAKGWLVLSLVIGCLGCGITKPADLGTALNGNGGGGRPGVGGLGAGGAIGGTGGGGPGGQSVVSSGGTNVGSGGAGGVVGSGAGGGAGGPVGATGGLTSVGGGGAIGSGGNKGSGAAAGGTSTGSTGGTSGTATGGVTAIGGTTLPSGRAGAGGTSAGGGFVNVAGSGGAPVPLDATCDTPLVIPTDVTHVDVTVDTTGHPHTFEFPCAATSGAVVLSFILTQPELVYADTFGASWNTVLAFADQCDGQWQTLAAAGTMACSDDACGTAQSQAVALLGYGQHFLFVAGVRGASGPVRVHFQHAQVGSGPLAVLAAGSGSLHGTTQGRGAVSLCQSSAPENSYWWSTCPAYPGGTIAASTCTGTTFDTVLSLQTPSTGAVTCADDDPACGVQSKLGATLSAGAGLNVLTVDGTTGRDLGNYTLTYNRP